MGVEGVKDSAAYLLERRSMLLSGRQKLERSLQVSDMLTQTRHHHQDTSGDSERASTASTLSLSLSTQPPPSLICSLNNSSEERRINQRRINQQRVELMVCSFL